MHPSVYVVDGAEARAEEKKRVEVLSSSATGENPGAPPSTLEKRLLVGLICILLAGIAGGAVYFTSTLIDNTDAYKPTPTIELQTFVGTFTLSTIEFNPALNNHTTEEYQMLSHEVVESLNTLYSQSLVSMNYLRSEVTGFSSGSVIVKYVLIFRAVGDGESTISSEKLIEVIQNGANEQDRAILSSIDPDSIAIEEGTKMTTSQMHTETDIVTTTKLMSTQEHTDSSIKFTTVVQATKRMSTQEQTSDKMRTTPSNFTEIDTPEVTQVIATTTKPDPPKPFSTHNPGGSGSPVSVCGVKPQQMTQRIIGGHVADRSDWPWLVSLQYRFTHLCGAAVIAEDWLLTASHCLYEIDYTGLSVFLNSTIIGSGGYHVYIEDVYLHPDYDDDTFDYDIALLRLRNRLLSTTISPICVETFTHENLNLDNCVIAGWGLTHEDGHVKSKILLEARVPIIPRSTCYTFLYSFLTDRMICAGYAEGGIDSCTGDSGGPLVCPSVDGIWQVVGVTSWGIGCGRPERPGVYADVSSMSTWIFNTMG